MGLQADPSEPAPLEVRVVRPLPVEALTLNHVPCPVSPSLTAWRTARGFAQGCRGCVVSRPVCWREASPPVLSTMHPIPTGNMSSAGFCQAVPPWVSQHQAGRILGKAGRGCCKPSGQHRYPGFRAWISSEEGETPTELHRDAFPAGGDEDYRGSVNLAGAGLRALAAAAPFRANASRRSRCCHEPGSVSLF